MSLINDALRRANPSSKESISSAGLGVCLQPVEYKRGRKPWFYLLAGPLGVCLFGLSAWLLWPASKATPKIPSLKVTSEDQALPRDVVAARVHPVLVARPVDVSQQERP